MIENEKVQKMLFGGDYNPEQWPEDTWEEDMRLLKLAHIDVVTLNVFSWAALQPDENTYCFDETGKGTWHESLSCYLHRSTSGMAGKKIPGYAANRI